MSASAPAFASGVHGVTSAREKMTYREALNRKFLISLACGVPSIIACGITIEVLKTQGFPELVFIPAVVLFSLIVCAADIGVKCGKCRHAYFGIPKWRIRYGPKKNRINFCPYCGVNLDGEIP